MGLGVLDKHVQFVKEHPDHAEWVKTHLPAELWEEVETLLANSVKDGE